MSELTHIDYMLGGAEDLLLGQGQVTQTRNGSEVVVTKINAEVIPYSGEGAAMVSIKQAIDSTGAAGLNGPWLSLDNIATEDFSVPLGKNALGIATVITAGVTIEVPLGSQLTIVDNTSFNGEANTASNLGAGAQVFANKTGVNLAMRSITAGAGISVMQAADTITIESTAIGAGEANTASNLGAGQGLFASKIGADLRFKSLVAGTGISLSNTSNEITLSASANGEANTASNLGAGAQVFANKTGVNLAMRSITAGAGISVMQAADTITIESTAIGAGEANTASNLGAGQGLFASKIGADLRFKSLVAGTNLSMIATSDTLTLNAVNGGDAYLANAQTFTNKNTFTKGVRNNVAKEDKFVLKGNGGLYDWDTPAFKDVFFAVDIVDDRALGNLEHSHSANFNFRYTGNGTIGSYNGEPQSLSFSAGLLSNTEKWGSGSGHAFTANVTVMNTTGYAEGGGFQGVVTNTSSFSGIINYLSLFEGIVKDSGLATHMSCAALRVVKDNLGSTGRTHAITVSGEGAGTIDAILALNPSLGASNRFNIGFDLTKANLVSGRVMAMPNNTSLAWARADGSVVPSIFMDSSNILRLKSPGYGVYEGVSITGADDSIRLSVDNYSPSDPVAIFCGGALRRVSIGAPDSGGTGFRTLIVPN